MKIKILAGIAVALIAVTIFVFLGSRQTSGYSVNDVSSDPAAFKGEITVIGIMAGQSQQDSSIFGIMDRKELQCTTPNCNKIIIPVRHQGKMPVIGDEVAVTGVFANEGEGFLFQASKLDVIKHHKIGG